MIFDFITFLLYGVQFVGIIIAAYYSYKGYCISGEIKKRILDKYN